MQRFHCHLLREIKIFRRSVVDLPRPINLTVGEDIVSFAAANLVPSLLQTHIHSFPFVLLFCLLGPMNVLFSCHCIRCTNHRRLCFLSRENPCRHSTCYEKGWEKLLSKKVVESSNNCFICSSIPISKNRVYIFGRTSTDLAGIIRSSLKFDVKKYHKDSNLFVCRQCFQQ